MRWTSRDPWRWRRRFAILPRRIDDQWIWLERWAYRFVPDSEFEPPWMPRFGSGWYEEYAFSDGRTVCCRAHACSLWIDRAWFRRKPALEIVA